MALSGATWGTRIKLRRDAARGLFSRLPLWASVALVIIFGTALLITLTWVLSVTFGTAVAQIDVFKVALTMVAGVGGAVALVVAYRRQRDLEQERFVERFGAAANQLGDIDPAVRIAGVYAMATAADSASNYDQRQQCINVLCGYLRLPFDPERGNDHRAEYMRTITYDTASTRTEEADHYRLRYNDRQVRKSIVRVIAQHLTNDAKPSWSAHKFDFTGAYLEDVEFSGVRFESTVWFARATFAGDMALFHNVSFHGLTRFDKAVFKAGTEFGGATFDGPFITFADTVFEGSYLNFSHTHFKVGDTKFESIGKYAFKGGKVDFGGAVFNTRANFGEAKFIETAAIFDQAHFGGEFHNFDGAHFNAYASFYDCEFEAAITFYGTAFAGEGCTFFRSRFNKEPNFNLAAFSCKSVSFDEVKFSGVSFTDVTLFSCSEVTSFAGARFNGRWVSFVNARFIGRGTVCFGAGLDGTPVTFVNDFTDFSGVTFDCEGTLFKGTIFQGRSVIFNEPKKWNNVAFDWDADRNSIPPCVSPKNWPPKLASEPESATVLANSQ